MPGGPGGPGVSGGGPGGSREVQGGSRGFGRKTAKKPEKRSGTPTTQQHPGFSAGGSSRPNGSGYPLSVKPPKCLKGWRTYIYIYMRYACVSSIHPSPSIHPSSVCTDQSSR